MAELEHVMDDAPVDAARKRVEKDFKAFDVDRVAKEIRRQLIEDRAETRTERLRAREEPIDRLLRILEPLDVREDLARLDRDEKSRRHLPAPRRKGAGLGQAIE